MSKLSVRDDSHDKISINQPHSELLKLAEHIDVAAAARELILYEFYSTLAQQTLTSADVRSSECERATSAEIARLKHLLTEKD